MTKGISNQCAFKIYFDVEILQANSNVMRLKVYDSTGVLAFICAAETENLTGKYKVVFEMPAYIFNQRMYSVDFTLGNAHTKSILWRADKFLTLKMANEDSEIDNSSLQDSLQGIVKPLVTTQLIKMQ